MHAPNVKKLVLCIGAVGLLAAGVASASRVPGERSSEQRPSKSSSKEEKNAYPNSKRVDPKTDMPGSLGTKLNKAQEAAADGDADKAIGLIEEVIGDKKVTPYAKAFALYLRSNAKWEKEDGAGAIADLKEAIAIDALPNSNQFPALYTLAQFQLQEEQYTDSIKSVDQYIELSGDKKPEAIAIKGNALYRADRFQEAIDTLKLAIATSDKPQESWNQILMASYFELNQYGEAAKLSEAQLAKNPTDKKLIQQLASIYVNNEQNDKALKLLSDAKAKGLITTADDYKLLAQLYGQAEKPAEGAALLEEGFGKGAIPPSYEMYKLLGDSYSLADNEAKAIDAYGKASPLAKDGEADLLRGQLQVNNQQWAPAKESLTKAISRGVKRQGAAYVLLGNAENELGNKAAAIAAMEKAKGYDETREMAGTWLKMIKGGGVPKKK
ncbi:tetratricopeptide repeat protein [Tahibacter aquaticus]|uniref:Tetratricopeptide repeat protein n=1 Tax=Tahibacter aquaticus TaxID=520092 RepID=A0A4R6Z6W5_9GAMM|nr:tetratricopeptide repeat protein [Tahibacter aquaticus]TDR47520.1 tetratricopeptide repeat protein [Tahibacter aquaticus]